MPTFGEYIAISQFVASLFIFLIFYRNMKSMKSLTDKYEPIIKQYMTKLGVGGHETIKTNKAEQMVMNDIMGSQMPEIQVLKSILSGETLEYLEENPQVLVSLYMKYEPLIKDIMGKRKGTEKRNYSV